MPHTPLHITKTYEKKHLEAQAILERKILQIYEAAIKEASAVAALGHLAEGAVFELKNFPLLRQKINQLAAKLTKDITVLLNNGIQDAWDLSNKKNDAIFDHRISKTKLPDTELNKFYNPNYEALTQFQKRATSKFALSNGSGNKQGVWNLEADFKRELEQSLGEGIANGKSAAKMTKDAKEFLKYPDKLFRRVRDAKGRLKLSKNARTFNPGKGVYRSSFKNALRLTATETNMAYRKADNLRYQSAPDVVGYQVELSGSHPEKDICDPLAKVYPVTFVWMLWHPFCLCFCVPVLCSEKEFEAYLDAVENGREYTFKETVKDMPVEFNNYVRENAERINRLKSPPYWVRDNKLVTEYLLK